MAESWTRIALAYKPKEGRQEARYSPQAQRGHRMEARLPRPSQQGPVKGTALKGIDCSLKRKIKSHRFSPIYVDQRLLLKIDQKRPFVHNSVCLQFLEGLFAILAECSQFCLRSF